MKRLYTFDDTSEDKNCGDYLVLLNKRHTYVRGMNNEDRGKGKQKRA